MRFIATPQQLRGLLRLWRLLGAELEPERLIDVLPLLAEFYKRRIVLPDGSWLSAESRETTRDSM